MKKDFGGTIMIKHKSDVVSYNNKAFSELHDIKALLKATITYCNDKEFKGIYYDLSNKLKEKLSEERNEYVSLLEIAINKLDILININTYIEKELL